MNERVKELRDEILAEAYQKQQGMDWVMERFAELIVRECATIAEQAEPYRANDLILKHFGVEE